MRAAVRRTARVASIALFPFMIAGCADSAAKSAWGAYEGAIIVPVAEADRHELAAMIAGFSHRAGYYLRDSSNYMKDTTETLTFYIVVYRGLRGGDEWAEVQAHASANEYPIITFNRPPRGEAAAEADKAWDLLTEEVSKRWPRAGAVPILPHGGIPHATDLFHTVKGYKIDRTKANTYELPPSSPLLAN